MLIRLLIPPIDLDAAPADDTKKSLKMNDFISIFVFGRQLWLPEKPKHYVNKRRRSSQANLDGKFI